MSCKHEAVQPVGSISWCKRCGAVREGDSAWQLTQIALETMCPICEFGQPLPVEVKDGKKIFRWTCKHWINEGPLGANE